MKIGLFMAPQWAPGASLDTGLAEVSQRLGDDDQIGELGAPRAVPPPVLGLARRGHHGAGEVPRLQQPGPDLR